MNGRITDDQFYRLTEGYESEQAEIKTEAKWLSTEIHTADTAANNAEKLIAVTGKYTRIDIYYAYVGIVNIPTAEKMEEHAKQRIKQTA